MLYFLVLSSLQGLATSGIYLFIFLFIYFLFYYYYFFFSYFCCPLASTFLMFKKKVTMTEGDV